jgi:hypothetical protein
MAAEVNDPPRGEKLFGVAGLLMALCCLAGPAVLGAAAGAAIGNLLGVAAAVVIAVVCVALLRWRRARDRAC